MREAKRENTRYERVMQDRNTFRYAPGLGNPTSRTCKRRAVNTEPRTLVLLRNCSFLGACDCYHEPGYGTC